MASEFHIKKGDLLPTLKVKLADHLGIKVDLTNASTVSFKMENTSTGVVKVNAAAAFVDKPNGIVEYAWAGTDTDTEAIFRGEFIVVWPGAKQQTFPSRKYITVFVETEVA